MDIQEKLKIKTIPLIITDDHITNCYLIYDNLSREAILVDPGGEATKIIHVIDKEDVKLKYIVLTHCHGDHISGTDEIKYKYDNAKIAIHKDDVEGFVNPNINYSKELGLKQPKELPEIKLTEGKTLSIGTINFKVIHTPGHTQGGICLYNEENKVLFSGDTLFANTYGRTDLETASLEKMKKSLIKLFELPVDTVLYPGHGKTEKMSFAMPRVKMLLAIKR